MDEALPPPAEIAARLLQLGALGRARSHGPDGAGHAAVRAPAGREPRPFGAVRTGLYMPRYHVEPGHNPYEVEIALIDDLRPGEVAVFACDGPPSASPPGASC